MALYVPHREASVFAVSQLILHGQSLLLMLINLLYSVHGLFENKSGSIQSGKFLIMNRIFSNKLFMSPFLSTYSPFWLIIKYLWLWSKYPYKKSQHTSQDKPIWRLFSMKTFLNSLLSSIGCVPAIIDFQTSSINSSWKSNRTKGTLYAFVK